MNLETKSACVVLTCSTKTAESSWRWRRHSTKGARAKSD